MKLVSILTIWMVGVGAAVAQEQEKPASRPSADQIRAEIKNLDHESFETRTRAMEQLRAAGEAAREALEAAKASPSLEVRTRAETLLKELDAPKPAMRGELRPVAPEDEGPRRAPKAQRGRDGAPRFEDFEDPRVFMDALQKWMAEMDKDTRFPGWVLPDDLKMGEPGAQLDLGSSFSVIHRQDGETVTFKSSPDGVNLSVERRDETGKAFVESYEAKDLEDFKAKYPEVFAKYGMLASRGGVGWTMRPLRPLPPIAPAPPQAPVVAPPKFGVFASPVPPILDRHLKLKGEGLVVDRVELGSLAQRIGVQPEDVLLSLNGQAIRSREDIVRAMAGTDPPATAKVVREGSVIELSAPK